MFKSYKSILAYSKNDGHVRTLIHQPDANMHPESEFLNLLCKLTSWLFEKSCLFKGQSVQQGSNRTTAFRC
jgi:hypothetical protein